MTRILVVDNYDSFVYTIVGYLDQLGADTVVVRNDAVPPVADRVGYDGVLVSPGPGTPRAAGQSMAVIEDCARSGTPMLGVCLGHQAIGQVYGGVVRRAGAPVHGKTDQISHDGRGVFDGLPDPFTATRYHSLVVDEALPDCLELSAWNAEGIVMGVRHRELPVHGVQFHPESILTEAGLDLLATFLRMTGSDVDDAHDAAGTDGATTAQEADDAE